MWAVAMWEWWVVFCGLPTLGIHYSNLGNCVIKTQVFLAVTDGCVWNIGRFVSRKASREERQLMAGNFISESVH